MSNRIRSIKYNSIMNIIRTLMGILFPLITFPYASRILLPEGIGQVNYVASIVSYFQMISALGITTYAITEGAKIRDDQNKLNKFSSEMFIVNLSSMIFAYLLLMLLIIFGDLKEYRWMFILTSISILFNTIGMEWLFNILEQYRMITIRSILVQFVSLILLFLFVRNQSDVLWYIAISVFASAGTGIFNLFYSSKFVKLFHSPVELRNIKKHLKPIFVIFGISLASTIYLNVDTTMLGYMKGDRAVGIYTAAVKINRIVITLIGSVSAVLLPRLSYYISIKDKKSFNNIVKKVLNLMLMMIIPSMVGLFFLSDWVLLILSGKDFLEASTTMKIMVFNLLLSPINGFLAYQIFMPFRRERISFIATLAGAFVNLILNTILIPKFAQEGAAIATILSEFIVFIVLFYFALEFINLHTVISEVWQYIGASLVIPVCFFAITSLNIQSIVVNVVLVIVISSSAYVLILSNLKNSLIKEVSKLLINRIKTTTKNETED